MERLAPGDTVYFADFYANPHGDGRIAVTHELIVHSVNEKFRCAAVRAKSTPDKTWWISRDGTPREWEPSFDALSRTPDEALERLYRAAEHGFI